MSRRLALVGSADLAQLAAHHAERDQGWQIAGFFDDFKGASETVSGRPILGKIDDVPARHAAGAFDALFVAIGYRHMEFRRACFERLSATVPMAALVHSSCFVDPTATVGPGALLLPGCVLDRGASIGANSVLNTGCVVAHDSAVGPHCFLGPGVTLAGFVTIEAGAFLGVGTTVIDGVVVGSGVRTGGGAVVTGDLREAGLWVGVPARRIRA